MLHLRCGAVSVECKHWMAVWLLAFKVKLLNNFRDSFLGFYRHVSVNHVQAMNFRAFLYILSRLVVASYGEQNTMGPIM